ncbi:hypothetical protein PAF17_17385, partial [Paracoccus sp. Z330]
IFENSALWPWMRGATSHNSVPRENCHQPLFPDRQVNFTVPEELTQGDQPDRHDLTRDRRHVVHAEESRADEEKHQTQRHGNEYDVLFAKQSSKIRHGTTSL